VDGHLISVAFTRDRVEGDMIQGFLRSAGIPSVLQQMGIDGPRLGIGLLNPSGPPLRVMVRSAQAEEARALLAETPVPGEPEDWDEGHPHAKEAGGRKPRSYGLIGAYGRIWAWSFGTMVLAFGAFLLLRMI
jgi:Putative prokaryotic signal transducing protein